MNSRNSNNNTEEKFLAANALVANIPLIKKIVKSKKIMHILSKNIMLFNSYYKLHQKKVLIIKLNLNLIRYTERLSMTSKLHNIS